MSQSYVVRWCTKPPTWWERLVVWAETRFQRYPPRHKGTPPTAAELGVLCEDFVGDAGTVRWAGDRWEIVLHGFCTRALGRISDHPAMLFGENQVRCIEVWVGEIPGFDRVVVDVITRQSDEFTNGAAERLAKIIARYWNGTREAL